MTQYNRIAVYGHRGWASSAIVDALAASNAPVKVLYRPGSDVAGLPSNVTKVEVDVQNHDALVAALQDVDIMISLVGHEGVTRQQAIVKAIPSTKVQLFSPSDLATRYDEQGLQIPVNKNKDDVEAAAKAAGIATTVVLPGNFAEFALNTITKSYIAAAYASIFTSTPISQLKNRAIGLSELKVTGEEVASALEKKHGKAPEVFRHSQKKVDAEVADGLRAGLPFTLAWYCRKIWATGQQVDMVGTDIWEVPGYVKASLEELIVGGKLWQYREMPPPVRQYFIATFVNAI
ncbi:hypothetical protein QQX98_006388 [Neonectria punicea]|uniref:NmrA-like domain-containing protein n=1 Tax=Neonectria punicea TaxID=979145 RepID=A0ABR1H179_9HYPO